MRLYAYVGPVHIAEAVAGSPGGTIVRNAADLQNWLKNNDSLVATFVINQDGFLLLADRHSEHVQCASGQSVRSAGEICFNPTGTEVIWVSNQSTGYCPESASWPAVSEALHRINIDYPEGFEPSFEFRWCENCEQINLIKEDNYYCAICEKPLPKEWNFN